MYPLMASVWHNERWKITFSKSPSPLMSATDNATLLPATQGQNLLIILMQLFNYVHWSAAKIKLLLGMIIRIKNPLRPFFFLSYIIYRLFAFAFRPCAVPNNCRNCYSWLKHSIPASHTPPFQVIIMPPFNCSCVRSLQENKNKTEKKKKKIDPTNKPILLKFPILTMPPGQCPVTRLLLH